MSGSTVPVVSAAGTSVANHRDFSETSARTRRILTREGNVHETVSKTFHLRILHTKTLKIERPCKTRARHISLHSVPVRTVVALLACFVDSRSRACIVFSETSRLPYGDDPGGRQAPLPRQTVCRVVSAKCSCGYSRRTRFCEHIADLPHRSSRLRQCRVVDVASAQGECIPCGVSSGA